MPFLLNEIHYDNKRNNSKKTIKNKRASKHIYIYIQGKHRNYKKQTKTVFNKLINYIFES